MKYDLDELKEKIVGWTHDRNLQTGNPEGQVYKLFEEFGELTSGLAKGKGNVVIDSIGDIFVVLTVLGEQVKIKGKKYYEVGNTDKDIKTFDAIVNLTNSFSIIASAVQGINKETNHQNLLDLIDKNVNNSYALLEILSRTLDLDYSECVKYAYEEIKDRKGRLVDGIFIKESDL